MAQSFEGILCAIQVAKLALGTIERPEPGDHPRWGPYNRVRNAVQQIGLARECLEKLGEQHGNPQTRSEVLEDIRTGFRLLCGIRRPSPRDSEAYREGYCRVRNAVDELVFAIGALVGALGEANGAAENDPGKI